jgi:hypothetical protein
MSPDSHAVTFAGITIVVLVSAHQVKGFIDGRASTPTGDVEPMAGTTFPCATMTRTRSAFGR